MKTNLRVFFSLCLLIILSSPLLAAWQSVGNVTRVEKTQTGGVTLQTSSGAKIRVEFFDTNVVRVRVAPVGIFERDFSYAIQSAERQKPVITMSETTSEIVLTNSEKARVVIKKSPFSVAIFDENGEAVLADTANTAFDNQTGAVESTILRRGFNETYYGFGEKAFPLSRDGQVLSNWNTDTYRYTWGTDPLYQAIPFFIALHNGKSYGLFFHNTHRTSFDMGKTAVDRYSLSAAGGELDYFVFTGGRERSPAKILADYTNLTGRMPLPPLWSLGYQQSRFSYFPEARVREIAKEFRQRRIPADTIYIDIDFMDGFRIFTWDKEKFPNPSQMIADLKKDGFYSIVIVNPAVKKDDNYFMYREGREQNFFVKRADGTEFNGSVWAGNSAFIDFTNPNARAWYGAKYKIFLEQGVAGFWNDMNEPSVFPDEKENPVPLMNSPFKTIPLDARHDGDGFVAPRRIVMPPPDRLSGKTKTPYYPKGVDGTHARFHNVYGMQMARATWENLSKLEPNKRPFVLSRAGFSGVQRYAAVWTGDNTASWEHLQLSLPMLLNMSVSGIPFVGADVGGYSDNPSGELFARWLQSAALTPLLRPHAEKGTVNKEPWEFGADFEKINRASIELRYQFLPYIYTLFRQQEENGQPVLRPLWFAYPKDAKTYLIDDQYLVGGDMLVAPVVRQGQTKRNVYFPAGDDWRDWQTGALYKGGTAAEVDAPLEKLPLFVRVGAVIPTQPVVQHTGEMANAPVTLNVVAGIAPDKTETAALFQDAGDGYGYKSTAWREVKVTHKKGLLSLTRMGDYASGQKVRFIEAIGIENKPSSIRIDGASAEITFNQANKRARIELVNENAKEIALEP
jgi:alpha-glucosidase